VSGGDGLALGDRAVDGVQQPLVVPEGVLEEERL
jgi:hypothetical protein